MPNHLHGIVVIDTGHPDRSAPDTFRSPSHTLGAIIRGFKGATTRLINEWRKTPGVPIWQRSYHDRVILSHAHLEAARSYIDRNPALWRDEDHSLPDW
jgi:REP element-mobilizing transposase RayT